MPDLVLVRNQAPGCTVFTDKKTGNAYEWQGRGDPGGEDLQYVDPDLMKDPNFRRALDRRVLVIEDASPEILEQNAKRHEDFLAREAAAATAVLDKVDQQAANDILAIPCIGPGARPGVACGAGTMLRESQVAERPPLCSTHAHLSNEYVPKPSPSEVDDRGNPKTVWVRAAFSGTPLPSQHEQ